MPKLIIRTDDSINQDNTYPQGHPKSGERWKFFIFEVENKRFSKIFSWIPRQRAESCHGKLVFYKKGEITPIFSFKGRWSSSPEIPYLDRSSQIIKSITPDPVTIPVGEKETMAVIVKNENDADAYGWNNLSYSDEYKWKNENYKLEQGEYIVESIINTHNGITFKKKFKLAVRKRIEDTILEAL